MSGRLKSDSLPKRTQKICFPIRILQTARLLNSLGEVSCCKSHLAGDRMCGFRPWLCDFHTLPSVGVSGKPLCTGSSQTLARGCDGSKSPFSPWLHPHQADAITGLGNADGGPPEEWGWLSDASKLTRESMRVPSRRAQSHRKEWARHTLECQCVWDTCIQHAQKSSNAGKGGHSLHLFYWKIHKEMLL